MENKKEKSFEENLENLENIVKKLENGDIPLDEAIEKFNEGMKLANECNKILEKANEIIKDTKNQYKIEFKDFTNVPLDVCIERDSKRENPLGEKVIRDIFNKYQTRYNLKEK